MVLVGILGWHRVFSSGITNVSYLRKIGRHIVTYERGLVHNI